ncbi:MAG: hypothetical protein HYX59_12560 [Elusimicrobia bacterium]|nr:hypothetical protein [Elusimicrobiota bacterium]
MTLSESNSGTAHSMIAKAPVTAMKRRLKAKSNLTLISVIVPPTTRV